MRRLFRRAHRSLFPEFRGDYPTWSDAQRSAKGYDYAAIAEKIRVATHHVKAGRAAFERDTVVFKEEDFRWPLLSNLLHLAGRRDGLHVADFGGSLGSVYFQHRGYLDRIKDLRWSVIELPEITAVGRKEFQNETLYFCDDLDQCSRHAPLDAVLFAGSMQYLETPFHFLERAAAVAPHIILDRVPFIDSDKDRITIQHPPPAIYPGSSPHWFFSEKKLDGFMRDLGMTRLVQWKGFDHPANIPSRYVGVVYAKPTRTAITDPD